MAATGLPALRRREFLGYTGAMAAMPFAAVRTAEGREANMAVCSHLIGDFRP